MLQSSVSFGTRSATSGWNETGMRHVPASTIWLICGVLCASLLCLAQPQSRPREPEPKQTAMTGCVDEQDGSNVLIDSRTSGPIANLEAEGFPREGFAKHLGHKVTVRGSVTSNQPRPLLKVRSIDMIHETCEPQQPRRL